MNKYIRFLQADKDKTEAYYKKSLDKTEQQKLLEELLGQRETPGNIKQVADIACGGGTLSYHVSRMYPEAQYHLGDINPDALEIARQINTGDNVHFHDADVNRLPFPDNNFDIVFLWQTLMALPDAHQALTELIRVVKPGCRVYVSSLFNIDHDVDLMTTIYDRSRSAEAAAIGVPYNTYSRLTLEKWLAPLASSFELVKFEPSIDFHYGGRGIGTFTRECKDGGRVQVSGGMLMNWAILIIEK